MTSASVRTGYDEGDFLIPALDAEGLLDKLVAYTGLMGASERSCAATRKARRKRALPEVGLLRAEGEPGRPAPLPDRRL